MHRTQVRENWTHRGEPLAQRLSLLPASRQPNVAGEKYCQAFHQSYGLETVCLRYFNVFGPRQDPNGPYAAVIPAFILKMASGGRPVIFGDGDLLARSP